MKADPQSSLKRIFVALLILIMCGSVVYLKWKLAQFDVHEATFAKTCRSMAADISIDGESALCLELQDKLFFSAAPVRYSSPQAFSYRPTPADKVLRLMVFQNPNYMASMVYCYFVSRRWFDPEELPVDAFARTVEGFSIMRQELDAYKIWLEGEAGRECVEMVQDETGLVAASISYEMEDYRGILGLNPIAYVAKGGERVEAVEREMALTLNHERIHALQLLCPELNLWAHEQYDAIPMSKRKKFAAKHPGYNWEDEMIAVREWLAFKYEVNPGQLFNQLGDCNFTRVRPK